MSMYMSDFVYLSASVN